MKANTIGRALAACLCLGATAIVAAGPGASAAPVQQAGAATATPRPTNRALRFYGTGRNQVDRVKIPLGNPARPVNVGAGDFTLEFWIKALAADNRAAYRCSPANDDWINGHVVFDRDVYFAGDFGDYGISLGDGRLAFGVNNGSDGVTLCGTRPVADGAWHHVAVQRRASDGRLWLFVDGKLDAQADGPDGDISYNVGRRSDYPNDPFLVIGAEKHDAGPEYPSFSGWIDEVRLSKVLRYTGDFKRPAAAFAPDANTVALYHFDEASGTAVTDASGAPGGPSNGVLAVGGSPRGPARVVGAPAAAQR